MQFTNHPRFLRYLDFFIQRIGCCFPLTGDNCFLHSIVTISFYVTQQYFDQLIRRIVDIISQLCLHSAPSCNTIVGTFLFQRRELRT